MITPLICSLWSNDELGISNCCFEGKTLPQESSGFTYVEFPSLSQQYLSPDTFPGQGDNTFFTFSVNKDANFSINISAYYEPINFQGISSQKT
ncbi:MAG: hypothetical protein ACTSUE_03900 [Promethearchaeota archaeon]